MSYLQGRHPGLDPGSSFVGRDARPRGRASPNQVQHDSVFIWDDD